MPTSPACARALDYMRLHRDPFLNQLLELLRFPTISSAYPASQPAFDACVGWLIEHLRSIGFQRVTVLPTGGPPAVYAEWMGAAGAPTLLIYGHYDVMPVDPVEAWQHSPFEPCVEGGRIHARGASDDKGQFFAILCAVQAWLGVGGLPVNLKVLLEGEEEELSTHLEPVLVEHHELLRCDGILIADMGGLAPQIPLIELGTRGNCSMEVHVQGPARDLHSGTYGGAVDNPFNVLVRLLAALQDGDSRRVLVPGFYNHLRELTPRERAFLNAVPIPDAMGLAVSRAPALGGEPGYPLKERVSWRPTFDIHGIRGGYTGPGTKTVIPAEATAKLSFRLVPDQNPLEIFQLVSDYLIRLAPPTVRLTCIPLGMAEPVTIDVESSVIQAANAAYQQVWGVEPVYVRGGGSLPVATLFQRHIHPDLLLTGFGLPEDGEHSVNESFALQQFYRGIEMMVYYFDFYRS